MKFRNKPVIVEAIQFNGKNLLEIKKLFPKISYYEFKTTCINKSGKRIRIKKNCPCLIVYNVKGVNRTGYVVVWKDYWLVQEKTGEFHSYKPDKFAEIYKELY